MTASTGPGVHLVAPRRAARQHADPAVPRQRLAQRRPAQPTAAQTPGRASADPGFASLPSSRSMPPPHGSRSTSSASGGRLRQRGREHRRPGSAAAADHGDHPTARAAVAQPTPRLRRDRAPARRSWPGSVTNVLGADGDRRLPIRPLPVRSRLSRITWPRRGSAARPHRRAARLVEQDRRPPPTTPCGSAARRGRTT